MIKDVVDQSGLKEEALRTKLRTEAAFVETMLYCQHGRPDLIEIDLERET
jgi:hypothetical protein